MYPRSCGNQSAHQRSINRRDAIVCCSEHHRVLQARCRRTENSFGAQDGTPCFVCEGVRKNMNKLEAAGEVGNIVSI
jgi:hypothetical protein